jgi:hypothetical protein
MRLCGSQLHLTVSKVAGSAVAPNRYIFVPEFSTHLLADCLPLHADRKGPEGIWLAPSSICGPRRCQPAAGRHGERGERADADTRIWSR